MKKSGLNYVLTYNEWTGWNSNCTVGKFFKKATVDDLNKLVPGDEIWIDEDPIHPNVKVYGFHCSEFKSFSEAKIYHKYGMSSFSLGRIYLVDDVEGLLQYVAENPLCTDVVGDSGRMATAIVNRMNLPITPEQN